jgi:hypothetical protein
MVEYLVVAGAIVVALAALRGPLLARVMGVASRMQQQFQPGAANGTADALLQY